MTRMEAYSASFRVTAAYLLLLAVLAGFAFGKISGDHVLDLATAAIMFYFGQRAAEKRSSDSRSSSLTITNQEPENSGTTSSRS
jgi:hypothetical protein